MEMNSTIYVVQLDINYKSTLHRIVLMNTSPKTHRACIYLDVQVPSLVILYVGIPRSTSEHCSIILPDFVQQTWLK